MFYRGITTYLHPSQPMLLPCIIHGDISKAAATGPEQSSGVVGLVVNPRTGGEPVGPRNKVSNILYFMSLWTFNI